MPPSNEVDPLERLDRQFNAYNQIGLLPLARVQLWKHKAKMSIIFNEIEKKRHLFEKNLTSSGSNSLARGLHSKVKQADDLLNNLLNKVRN